MSEPSKPVLYVVVCAAGPARDIGKLLKAARDQGWESYAITTADAWRFVNPDAIEEQTGHPIRLSYRSPGEPRSSLPHAAAVIVAPATFNTINKLAAGISDNYALGVLAECIGVGVPVVVLPFINSALATRSPLRESVEVLRAEGVHVMLGVPGFEPHAPGRAGRGSNRLVSVVGSAAGGRLREKTDLMIPLGGAALVLGSYRASYLDRPIRHRTPALRRS